MFALRPYQGIACDYIVDWFASATPDKRLLLSAPTGTGKSIIELEAQRRLEDQLAPGEFWIVTPRVEIVQGMLEKRGEKHETESAILAAAERHHITTPIRFRNRMLAGDARDVRGLILDEGHHDLASSMQDIHLLAGLPPCIALTATPYRGTPKGTCAFRAMWGEPVPIITWPEAIALNVISFPTCTTLPLVDDDEIEVRNGELIATQVDSAYFVRLQDLAYRVMKYVEENAEDSWWDRPTMFSMPSRTIAYEFGRLLELCGGPNNVVTGESSFAARRLAFEQCVESTHALVQVQVVSEGVDLPIRRLIDASPCMSPVKWLQQLGRITRPVRIGERPPEYVCTNRNLLRHGYLLDGCLPSSAYKEAEAAFGTPSRRAGSRVIGLEAIGRLQAVELPLLGGLTGIAYSMYMTEGHRRKEYFVIVHPAKAEPIWACRENVKINAANEMAYGKWQRCDPPEDVKGFASLPPKTLSDKQRAWWKQCAAGRGLDPNAEVTRKVFPALPVLLDTRSVV